MKGTAPRGRWLAEDEEIKRRLEGSVKDRAENAMIVDLLRNDLGRVARRARSPGATSSRAERFETVWQLTSTAWPPTFAPRRSLVDVFRALFPCGSVTGAPKVSTMGIIAALEHDAARRLLRHGRLSRARRAPVRARGSTSAIRTVVHDARDRRARLRGRRRDHVGLAAPPRSTTRPSRRPACSPSGRPPLRLLETLAHEPGAGYRRLEDHRARLRSSADYLGIEIDEAAIAAALDREAGRFPRRRRGCAAGRSPWTRRDRGRRR